MAEQHPKHRRKPAGIGRIDGRITADGLTHGDRSAAGGTAEGASTRRADAAGRVGGLVGRKLAAIGAATQVRFRAVFSDGSAYTNCEPGQVPEFTVTFRTARAALRVVAFGPVGLLESYFDGNLDIEGNFPLAFRAALDAGFDAHLTKPAEPDHLGAELEAIRARRAARKG
jgi:hypothetical protein